MQETEERQLKVALYLRVSSEDQVEKFGLQMQENTLKAFIQSKGTLNDGRQKMVLAQREGGKPYIYRDEGVSGSINFDERPGFASLMDDYENAPKDTKPFDVVCVYKIDRLARRLRILLDLTNYLEKQGLSMASANESIDTTTPFGRAILGIMGVIAELECETTKARTQDGRMAASKQGRFMGQAPYGYIKNREGFLTPCEEEAKIVKRIFRLYIDTESSTQDIATVLKTEKVLSPLSSAKEQGKTKKSNVGINSEFFWRDTTIRDILRDEVYTGLLYYNKKKDKKELPKKEWKLAEKNHFALISREDFQITAEKLDKVRERVQLKQKGEEEGSDYLLRSLLKCAACERSDRPQATFKAKRDVLASGKVKVSYQCGNKESSKRDEAHRCHVIPIPAEELHQFIVEFITRLLSDPKAVFNAQKNLSSYKKIIKTLKNEQAETQKSEKNLMLEKNRANDLYQSGKINTAELNKRYEEIKKREAELLNRQNKLTTDVSMKCLDSDHLEAFSAYSKKYSHLLEKNLADKKLLYRLIHSLIQQIVVYSREATELDVIAGRKTENQLIPHKIHIVMRLPKEMIDSLIKEKFNNGGNDGSPEGGNNQKTSNPGVLPLKNANEQDTGVEPAFVPWEGAVLPMHQSCLTKK